LGSACKPVTHNGGLSSFSRDLLRRREGNQIEARSVVDFGAMRAFFRISLILLWSASILAQQPTATGEAQTNDLGVQYSPPADWEVVNSNPTLGDEKKQAEQNASSDDEKKGVACAEVRLTARHGDPASVIVIVQLPFACSGQSMRAKDLPGFAQGAAEGIKHSFDLGVPVTHDYKLGSHFMWVERVKGTPKGHPEAPPYTVEITCTLVQKGAVCWMALASNDEALKAFEADSVKLEGDAPAPLVPPDILGKGPGT
jgi:hypothetical protein